MTTGKSTELRDLVLPVAVVAVVGMMIFPLPRAVLDVLLMCNISFALLLLVSSVYLSEAGKFTSLPSILLFATLFRLGLNISTTRQLLAHGDAPSVVAAFGGFVVSGNLVVGVVVFAIVTLVQFLVIAKGAERIAEVAARFTLDAMPGKQMSIDADIRAGLLSLSEAKEKRAELHREAKLYGALDGAMKFVKGDAIAGLIITVINITAGLIVGVSQQGLSLAVAAQKYTLFTIGDGLVSQIPALLVAVAAGIAVTRVENKAQSFVGRDVLAQLSREPQALGTTGTVLFGLAFVPGLPTGAFVIAALTLYILAYRGKNQTISNEKIQRESQFRPKVFSALVFTMSKDGVKKLQSEQEISRTVVQLRSKMFQEWGIIVPDIQFDVDHSLLGIGAEICLHGVPMKTISWNSEEAGDGFTRYLIQEFEQFLLGHLSELIDDTQTRMLLETHQPVAEDLINSTVPAILSVTALTTILRQLVLERVSIREMRSILQAIAEFHLASEEGTVVPESVRSSANAIAPKLKALNSNETNSYSQYPEILSEVRVALARVISKQVCDRDWNLDVWILSPTLDHLLAQTSFSGTPLEPGLVNRLLKEIVCTKKEAKCEQFTILTTKCARSSLSELVRLEDREIRVLAVEELSPEVKVAVKGDISFENVRDIDEKRNEKRAA